MTPASLPLCLPCLMVPATLEPKTSMETVKCECLPWCFPRKQSRKQRFPELGSWRWTSWPEQSAGSSENHRSNYREHGRRPNPLTQDTRLPCGLLPSQVSDLLDRDITPDDYDMLLQLDESIARPTASTSIVESLPTVDTEEVLGEICSICLVAFERTDALAALRCKHVFHQQCISKWLLERCRLCPLCGDETLQSS